MSAAGGALTPLLAEGRDDTTTSAHRSSEPQLLSPKRCVHGALPLPADAVAVAARVALKAERAGDRPRIINAALIGQDGAGDGMVGYDCGHRVAQRTVVVAIDLRRYHPSASLSSRVSFVARTKSGYRVYAIGH